MARGISRIPKRSKERHTEAVTTVGRGRRDGEGALKDIAKRESRDEGTLKEVAKRDSRGEEALRNEIKIECRGEGALRNVATKKSGDPRAATPLLRVEINREGLITVVLRILST